VPVLSCTTVGIQKIIFFQVGLSGMLECLTIGLGVKSVAQGCKNLFKGKSTVGPSAKGNLGFMC
jgi:hypothetical protein